MVVVAAVTLVLGVVKEQKLNKEGKLCKPSNKRRNIVITGVALVFLGFGFAVGKLIYLWSHI